MYINSLTGSSPNENFWAHSWLCCISSNVTGQIGAISDILTAEYNKQSFSGSTRPQGLKSHAAIILNKQVIELGIMQNINNKNIYIMANMKS